MRRIVQFVVSALFVGCAGIATGMAHMQTLGAMSPDGDFIVWLVVGLIGVGVQ
jgi:nitrogenase subunit NifH